MNICNYCNKREGKFYFKNAGKWCCENHFSKCPNSRKKNSESSKGRIFSKETIEKLKKKRSGINNPMFGKVHPNNGKKIHSKDSKEKISIALKGKNVGQKRSMETRKKMSLSKKFNMDYLNKKYPYFTKIEEVIVDSKSGKLQVHCKNHKCINSKEKNGWFYPTGSQISSRIKAIENNDGNYFYCSEECKLQCPLYNKKVTQLIREQNIKIGIEKESVFTSEEYSTWRKEVLKRSKNTCEYCGDKATHSHHSKPIKLEPFFSLDPDYGISCCKKCHFIYGHKDECSTGKLSSVICS